MTAPAVTTLWSGHGVTLQRYVCHREPGTPSVPEQHVRSCIAGVTRGSFAYHVRGSSTLLGPGSILLGDAGDEYACTHEHGCGDACVVVELQPEPLEAAASAAGRGLDGRGFGTPALPPLPRLAALLTELDEGPPSDCEPRVMELVEGVIAELGRRRGAAGPPRVSRRDMRRAAELAAFIDERIGVDEDLSLAALAARVGSSPFHVARTFRAATGLPPHQYVLRQRLRRALQLLRDPHLSVTDVAFGCGFGDLSNFHHQFRAHLGRTPRAQRERLLGQRKIRQVEDGPDR